MAPKGATRVGSAFSAPTTQSYNINHARAAAARAGAGPASVAGTPRHTTPRTNPNAFRYVETFPPPHYNCHHHSADSREYHDEPYMNKCQVQAPEAKAKPHSKCTGESKPPYLIKCGSCGVLICRPCYRVVAHWHSKRQTGTHREFEQTSDKAVRQEEGFLRKGVW